MVKSIHIQNFRCFEDFQLEGFGRVNLIGGMNNSGKTILLEGVWLGAIQNPEIIVLLKQIRHLNQNIWWEESTSTIWNDLFFNKVKGNKINIKAILSGEVVYESIFYVDAQLFPAEEHLSIRYLNQGNEFYKGRIEVVKKGSNVEKLDFVRDEYKKEFQIKDAFLPTLFIPTKTPSNSRDLLVKGYSELELDNNTSYVLEGLRAIDSSICEIKVVSLDKPNLFLRRENESLMALELFGDAMKKMVKIITNLVQSKNGLLLIDEIENGIHYTNQPKVWELIFKLANKFNVQVFATTHSKEMVQAFNKVALEGGFEEDAKYIEMARHYKTKQIIGTVLETNILKHKLEHNQAFRGE